MTQRTRAVALVAVSLLLGANLIVGVVFFTQRSGSSNDMIMPAHPMAMTGRTMSASSCSLVTTTQLASLVGRIVEPAVPRSTPRETSCTYPISSSVERVRITFSMFVSPRGFAHWADQMGTTGRHPRHLCGIGDSAYLATVRNRHGVTTALTMLVGSTQVLIEAPASVNRLTSLAHAMVPAV